MQRLCERFSGTTATVCVPRMEGSQRRGSTVFKMVPISMLSPLASWTSVSSLITCVHDFVW